MDDRASRNVIITAAMVGQARPDFNFDDVHRAVLDDCLAAFGLDALDAQDRHEVCLAWHRLDAWPGFREAAARLHERAIVASFTMLPTSLVIDVSRRNGLQWDAVVSCEMIGIYKPHPEAYDVTARWLGVPPAQIMMVACHNFDLDAARRRGYRTAFVRRPEEWGHEAPPDPTPNPACDLVAGDFDELANEMLARWL